MSVRVMVWLAMACLLAAPSAWAAWGECEECHSGAAPAGFSYGVCAHCHQVGFGPRHDPEVTAPDCRGCHPPAALHYLHPWEEACQGCHGPLILGGPRIFELDRALAATRQMLVIKGVGFGHAQGLLSAVKVGRVHYGFGSPRVLSWSNTEIRLRLPAYRRWESGRAKTRNVKVIVDGERSNKMALEIVKR